MSRIRLKSWRIAKSDNVEGMRTEIVREQQLDDLRRTPTHSRNEIFPMNRTTDVSDDAVPFSTVLEAERIYIEEWRKETGRTGRTGLTGLALSGGGIRSAVFCLGVIQALAKNGVLKNFDYLSTVSGGGYIGSSLTWFTNTVAQFGVEARDLPYGIDDPTQPAPKQPGGKPLLAHLRRHGSYLDPSGNLSLLSGIAVVLGASR